jgi:hypothetical protein
MKVLKKEDELSISDLMEFPVWKFAFEESKVYQLDTIMMKPHISDPPYDIHKFRFLIRTTFKLANNVEMKGYTKPFDLLDKFMGHQAPIDLSPVIITPRGHVAFCYGINKPNPEEISNNYLLLGHNVSEVFPVKFKTDMEITNGISNGVIEGFMYCEENEVNDFFRMNQDDIKVIK